MKHNFADEYAYIDSWLSHKPAKRKIVLSVIFVFLIVLTPITVKPAFGIYFFLISVLILISRIPIIFFIKRLLVVLPFVALVAVSIPFIQKDGLGIFVNCVIKALLVILSLTLLIQTTRFTCLLKALNGLKVPALIVTLLSFMYRYFFVLEDEVERKKRALELRCGEKKDFRILKSTANIIATLFIHTYERAERIYLAMCARGYKGSCEEDSGLS